MTIKKDAKIYIAGHRGLVGSAIKRNLAARGYSNIVGKSHRELDLLDRSQIQSFLKTEKPEAIIIAAALVGGIHANNTYRSEFIYNNLQIQNNIIWLAHELGVPNLIFLGSSCIYPRQAPQPMPETCLLTGPLEITNRPYALAKIAGLELVSCIRSQYKRNYFSVMPTNLYGPGDNFHPENSHVLPALIRRFHFAKEQKTPQVTIWGTGTPMREFMHVDDCADAICHLMETINLDSFNQSQMNREVWTHINVGSGQEISIANLAKLIGELTDYQGQIGFDATKPDGTPRKLLDVTLLKHFGWTPKINIREGLQSTIQWFRENLHNMRG